MKTITEQKPIYKLHLDLNIATKLRDTVNSRVNVSLRREQTLNHKNSKLYPAWNRICAIMDRIEDTAYYLNNLDVSSTVDERTAFSFFHLLNYSSVLVDCINEMARIYDIDMTEKNNSFSCFNQLGNDGTGTDKKYFEYLRSLCSVHPVDTTRHKIYANSDYICSPRVVWSDDFYRHFNKEPCDIYAVAYTNSSGNDKYRIIPIYVSQVINFVEYRYSLLNYIIDEIISYQNREYENFRKSPLKAQCEFDDYFEFLMYLREEGIKRFGGEIDHLIDKVILYLSLEFKNKKNQIALKKYQNALKYAIDFHFSMLQNMDYEACGNTGIYYPQKNLSTTLLDLLAFVHTYSEEALKNDYAITKILCLYESSLDYYYAMTLFTQIKPFLEKYVSFDEAKSPRDYSVLTEIALYLDALTCKNLLNQNIPNSIDYRLFCYEESEWNDLFKEESTTTDSVTNSQLDDIKALLEKYGPAFK